VEAKGYLSRRPRKWPHLDDTPEAIGEYLFIRPKLDSEHTFPYPLSSSHSSLFFTVTPPATTKHAMAIQKEPGQKGINWSNIAVGERVSSFRRMKHSEHG